MSFHFGFFLILAITKDTSEQISDIEVADAIYDVGTGNKARISGGMETGLPVVNSTKIHCDSPLTITLPSALRINSYLRCPRTRLISAIHVRASISSPR